MSTRSNIRLCGLVIATAFAFAGCNKPKDTTHAPATPSTTAQAKRVELDRVELGNAVGADKKVVAERDSFSPKETIYVSVLTKGSAPEATLTARWKFENNQLVQETSQKISPNGEAATEFHVQKPDGWPEGKYSVEILLDGNNVATKSFKVAAG